MFWYLVFAHSFTVISAFYQIFYCLSNMWYFKPLSFPTSRSVKLKRDVRFISSSSFMRRERFNELWSVYNACLFFEPQLSEFGIYTHAAHALTIWKYVCQVKFTIRCLTWYVSSCLVINIIYYITNFNFLWLFIQISFLLFSTVFKFGWLHG